MSHCHTKLKVALAILSLLLGLGKGATAEKTSGSGWVKPDGVKVTMKSAIAVWNAQGNRLTVYFFSFPLSQEQVDLFKKYPSRESAGDLGQKQPFVKVDIEFAKGVKRPDYRFEDVYFYAVTLWFGPGHQGGRSVQGGEPLGKLDLSGNYRSRKPVAFKASGLQRFEMDGTSFEWNLKANCDVLRHVSFEELRKKSEAEQAKKKKK